MTAPSLDRLLARAREVELRPEPREQCVADVQRLARLAAPEPRRRWWVGPALAVAAAAGFAGAVLLAKPHAPAVVAAEPMWLGDRVAVIPEAAASYRVIAADDAHTTIEVERGAVTARLVHRDSPYRLVLRGGGVEATATGTVYTLAVDEGGARVRVHEGTVRVGGAAPVADVHAGTTWSRAPGAGGRVTASSGGLGAGAAQRLLALAPVTPPAATATPPTTPDAPIIDSATDAPPIADAAPAARPPRPGDTGPPDSSPGGRWRRARLLRGQGKADEARTLLLAISADGDPTWAPLAHIEAIRIDLEDRAAPEDALALADRALARWPTHALATEVRTLRCRALGLLGRGAECDRAAPAPDP